MHAVMPAGVVSTADLVAHYAAVRKRLLRSHLRVVPPPPKIICQPGWFLTMSASIVVPPPSQDLLNWYAQEITVHPGVLDLSRRRRPTPRMIALVVADYFEIDVA